MYVHGLLLKPYSIISKVLCSFSFIKYFDLPINKIFSPEKKNQLLIFLFFLFIAIDLLPVSSSLNACVEIK